MVRVPCLSKRIEIAISHIRPQSSLKWWVGTQAAERPQKDQLSESFSGMFGPDP